MSNAEGLRKRFGPSSSDGNVETDHFADGNWGKQPTAQPRLEAGTFWLTRIVLLRYISFIFCKCKMRVCYCNGHSCASGVPIVCITLCKRPPISYVYFASVISIFFYVLNIKHFTSDNTSPNTNPKSLTTLNLTLNGRNGANISY